jgi:hypothetical protein
MRAAAGVAALAVGCRHVGYDWVRLLGKEASGYESRQLEKHRAREMFSIKRECSAVPGSLSHRLGSRPKSGVE